MSKRKNKSGFDLMPNQMYYTERLVKKQGNPCAAKAKFTPNKFKVHRRG